MHFRLEYRHGGWAVVTPQGEQVAAFGGGPLELRKARAYALRRSARIDRESGVEREHES